KTATIPRFEVMMRSHWHYCKRLSVLHSWTRTERRQASRYPPANSMRRSTKLTPFLRLFEKQWSLPRRTISLERMVEARYEKACHSHRWDVEQRGRHGQHQRRQIGFQQAD